MKKFTLILSLLFLVFFTTGCGQQAESSEETITKKQVKVQNIAKQNEVETSLVLSGTVTPKEYSVIRSLTPGTIQYLAPVGSDVYAGQPLFSISDQGIQNAYFNAQQSLSQTNAVTSQQVSQAELAVNSAKASLDLARSQYENRLAQNEQALSTSEDSALVAYNSAYNAINQALVALNEGNIASPRYLYRDILTAEEQLRTDTTFDFEEAIEQFSKLDNSANKDSLANDLENIYQALLSTKNLLDNTSVLLQNAIPSSSSMTASDIATAKASVGAYQTQINTYLSSTIGSISSLSNVKISNRLALDQVQGQLDLAEIQYNNSLLSLNSARESAELQKSGAQAQFDNAAYAFGNLSISAPFSGKILSHYVGAGQQVSPGQELIEIGNLAIIEISVSMDVDFAGALKLGDEVMINDQYKGMISEIEPTGDLKSGKVSVTVQSSEAEANLVSGEIADVKFDLKYSDIDSIVVPIKSVTIEASGNYAFVLDSDNKVVRKNVTLGKIFNDKVSVLSGLEEGDRLVLLNGVFVSSGDEVEFIQE